jgi:hypothetical protein
MIMKKITLIMLMVSFLGLGQELIADGGFENLTTGNVPNTTTLGVWASTSSANTAIQQPADLANVHTGTFSVNLGNDFANLRQYFTGDANIEYTVSFWYKMNFAGVDPADAPFVSIRTQAGPANGNGTIIGSFSNQLDAAATDWTKFTFTFQTNETAIQFFVFSPARLTGGTRVNNSVRFDDISIVPTSTLSLEEFDQFKFSFYPNPVGNLLNLTAEKTIDKIEIYSLLGQKVYTEKFSNRSGYINLSNLTSGIYLMKTYIEEATKTYKIIKE